ncbi:hypothetical protein ElyMa_006302500 [Elysia marginata]|uniref:Uncharacterized protein n=1 Tax=Elysia marginata TaxID=1093978 RepID=A0AAV4HHS1_9GAST|nr:hypothetical protein ElyMa_006302500 [Elysia marginata]
MAILKQDLSFLKNNVKQVDAEIFTSKIRGIMDNHAPQTSRIVTDQTSSPWFSVESEAAKQARRRAERKWNKSGLEIDKQIYLYQKEQVRGINLTAKREYYNLKFSEVQNSKDFLTYQMNFWVKTKILSFQRVSRVNFYRTLLVIFSQERLKNLDTLLFLILIMTKILMILNL